MSNQSSTTSSQPQPGAGAASSSSNDKARVCAIVVTFNRKERLRECLAHLRAQERSVDRVLVVDNASTDGTSGMVREEFAWCELLALPLNSGGAGGFHDGMKWALENGFDWMWLMDDDALALPDCLGKLLVAGEPGFLPVPLQQNKLGYKYGISVWTGTAVESTERILNGELPRDGHYLFAFVGPLVPREVVEKIGLPHHNFFIYFDDWEYALRMESHTDFQVRVVPDALFLHDIGGAARHARFLWRKSVRVTPAPWKLYYGARNAVWTLRFGGRPKAELRTFLGFQLRWILGDLLFEPDRTKRVRARVRGISDGLRARMGKRI